MQRFTDSSPELVQQGSFSSGWDRGEVAAKISVNLA